MLEDEGLDRNDEDEVVENEVHGEDDNQNVRVPHFKQKKNQDLKINHF